MKKNTKTPSSTVKQFQNYTLSKSLGEGTFGKVKLGTHIATNENVAIKILQKKKITEIADTQRVLREIHILKLVRHPNVVQLYEIIETPKQLFLIMEYMENGELFNHIVKNKRLREDESCRLFHQLIDGIEHIHKIGVAHRDLKPQNLLLDYRNNLRIVDFGLSNTYKKSERLKTACGSPCYAAPEMLKGQSYQGLAVDIWSSGVILFAMLCGYLPFQDKQNQAELYQNIMSGEYTISVSLSDAAKDLIRKILTVDPQHRYTIEQIRKHPWMTMNSSHRSSRGIVIGYNKIPIDMQVLGSLKDMDLDVEKTQSCIEANRHNNLTTTYYLALKKHIRQGGETACDLAAKNFDRSLLEPAGLNNRRDTSKTNAVIVENLFPVTSTEGNVNVRKKSKERIRDRDRLDKSREKENRQPNRQKSKQKQNMANLEKPGVFAVKKSRANSKVTKIDPRIESSLNYGRPSTAKSIQKPSLTRESQFENRINRRYKQKFNQSLVSKSRDRITQSSHGQQQSFYQPHLRSRVDSSVTRRNETYELTEIMQEGHGKKRTNSKKTCAQSIKSDMMLKIAKARWM